MSDDVERLSRVLDDLAAERDPRDRADLSASEAELAETAALLKMAGGTRAAPSEEFLARLGAELAAVRASAEAPAQPPQPGVSRRGMLGRLAAAAGGLAIGAGTGAAAAYQKGHQDGYHEGSHDGYNEQVTQPFKEKFAPWDRGEWLDTGLPNNSVPAGEAVRFSAGAVEGYIVNPGNGGKLYALSASCTHMGCMITWLSSAGTFLCPCHGAQYKANGDVLSGIARQPLPRLLVKRGKNGHLHIYGVATHPRVTTLAPYQQP